jgi:hypothetical protein
MSDIEQPNFKEMDRSKLMQYATHLRVSYPNTATKEDLLEMIDRKLQGRATATLAEEGSRVPPGHAKIRLLEDPMPGSSNLPVYVNANGYQCTIPRGKDVIVPMRVVRTLQDASVKRRKQTSNIDQQGREYTQDTEISVPSYPFQILEMTPGEEPMTTLEKAKARSIGPRKRYQQQFGYWPRPGQLQNAIEKGLISLSENEELPPSEAKLKEDKI